LYSLQYEASLLQKMVYHELPYDEPKAAFERVVVLATQLFDVPLVTVTFLNADRAWYRSKVGLDVSSRPRSASFCTWGPADGSLLEVEDATTDERFAQNEWVTGPPHVRFVAVAPLLDPHGALIGGLCIMDQKPRRLSSDERASLLMLRDMAAEALELHLSSRAFANLLESISDAFFALDTNWTFTYVNQQAEAVLERSREELLGKNVWQEFPEAVDLPFYTHYHRAVDTGEQVSFEAYFPPLKAWFRVNAYPYEDGLSVYFNDVTEQVEQTIALQEREQYLSIMLRSIGDAVITTDAKGRVREMNVVAEELTGWSVEEAQGTPLIKVFPIHNTHSGERVESPVDKVLRKGGTVGMANHTVLRARDGTEYQIADSAAPIRDAEGTLLGIVMVFRDVTQAYRQREREATQRKRFELALRGGNLGLYDWNVDTGAVAYNDRWAEMLGHDPAELEGTVDDFTERAHPQDAEGLFAMFERHFNGELPFAEMELRMRAKDGSWRWILDRGQVMEWNPDGTPARVVGTHLDITPQKEREAMLQAREQQLQTLYDAMSTLAAAATEEDVAEHLLSLITETLRYRISVVRLLRDGQLEAVAISAEAQEQLPHPRPTYMADDDYDAVRAWKTQETVVVPSTVAAQPHADLGSIQSAVYIPIPSFGVISVASTVMEGVAQFDVELLELLAQNAASVLQRIRQEDDLRQARDTAQEMNRLKTSFLANMSHEIRTPLTSILGFAEMLSEMGLEEPAGEFTERIQRSSHRLLETLTSVLDLSQLEAGAMKLIPRAFVLQEVIEDAVHGFSRAAADQEITLEVVVPDDPIEVYQDRAALQRVVTNLVSNAVKFTLTGGVTVRLEVADTHCRLTVADTGVGISPDFLPQLFEAFVQESKGDGRSFEGTGLGLAITRDLVELMGGEIAVDSEKGVGTTFVVSIPSEMR
jgi:PAS domain S-box-containing protein